MVVALGLDIPEGCGAIDAEIGSADVGMVQNIGRIHAELDPLRFREPDGLTHRDRKSVV